VQFNCHNDLAILLSSGFEARKPNAPIGMLERPSNFTLENGPNPGCIKLSVNKVPGAIGYTFEYAAVPVSETTQWVTYGIRARTHIIEGLSSGQQYAFRVAGIGTDSTRVYSDVISRYAQ
jgi:hypothetical protein